ncbi:MAG: AMP-binding protein [Verrucomicrobia bacterium]|nr:AMP-binding protein [Verrucomicrobiota bacterium]
MTSHSQSPRTALRTAAELLDVLSGRANTIAVLALQETDAERWSCAELADCVRQLARGLADAGVKCGDHVVLLADNRPEWIVAALAVMAAGGVVVPLDAQLADKPLAHCLADSETRLVFTTADGAARTSLGGSSSFSTPRRTTSGAGGGCCRAGPPRCRESSRAIRRRSSTLPAPPALRRACH